jgi:hypothetical protein
VRRRVWSGKLVNEALANWGGGAIAPNKMCTAYLHINRLSVFHAVPKGIAALLSLPSSFRAGKIITIYSDN